MLILIWDGCFCYGCGVICLLIRFVCAFIWVGFAIGLLCVSCLLFIYALVFGFACVVFGCCYWFCCWFWFDLVRFAVCWFWYCCWPFGCLLMLMLLADFGFWLIVLLICSFVLYTFCCAC